MSLDSFKTGEQENTVIWSADYSKELNDFLSDETLTQKKTEIENVLKKDEKLKSWLENFLQNQNTEKDKERVEDLKFALMTSEFKDIAGVIAEHVWYSIWETTKELDENISWNSREDSFIQTAEKEAQTAEKEAQVGIKVENMESMNAKMEKLLEERTNLLNSLPQEARQKLDEKTKKQRDEVKNKLPEKTKKQLKKIGYNEDFIDNYILVRVTLNEVKWNPAFKNKENEIKQFEKSVNEISNLDAFLKNIDNNCNIADTYLNSFSEWNISQTRREIFNEKVWNEDLREEKKRNRKERNKKGSDWESAYDKMFPKSQSEEELIDTYWKFYQPKDWEKNLLEEYNNHRNNLNDLKEYKETKDYRKLLNKINKIKDEVEEKTKDLVDELCILSQVKWMYMCMWEWNKNNFELNKANEIENNDWILTLKGHIDWIDFSIRQNTKDPNAHLQTSKKIIKPDEKSNYFKIGWDDNFEDSKFVLPSQDEIFNVAVESVKSDWALERAATPWEYVKLMQERFMSRIDKKYEDTKYVHHYMREQVKWEKIVDSTIKTVEKIKGSKLNSTIDDVGPNKKLYDFIKLIDFNVRKASDAERDKLDEIMKDVQWIVSAHIDGNSIPWQKYPEITEHYFRNQNVVENTKKALNGEGKWDWESLFDFFMKYANRSDTRWIWESMINVLSLNVDLTPSENPDENCSMIAKKRNDDENVVANADKVMDEKIDKLYNLDNPTLDSA